MNLKNTLAGYKTYLMAAVAILGLVLGYINGEVDLPGLLAGAFVAVQTVFLRSGVKSEADRTLASLGIKPPSS